MHKKVSRLQFFSESLYDVKHEEHSLRDEGNTKIDHYYCAYACMCVHVLVRSCVCVCSWRVYYCASTCMCWCVHVYVYACVSCMSTCVCMYVCVGVHVWAYLYLCVGVCMSCAQVRRSNTSCNFMIWCATLFFPVIVTSYSYLRTYPVLNAEVDANKLLPQGHASKTPQASKRYENLLKLARNS